MHCVTLSSKLIVLSLYEALSHHGPCGEAARIPAQTQHEVGEERPFHQGRVSSVQMSKASEVSTNKAVLQPSEPNTNAESATDAPCSAHTTRRKAKDIQARIGKGRAVLVGGSGARHVTKVIN
ncbi:hypothetical protein JB92DRAFT_1391790 [Gautieria morchelliformis]|nr:hypothetical protein JB92DRAFT_1391790 [Gautieria morchelliformis]